MMTITFLLTAVQILPLPKIGGMRFEAYGWHVSHVDDGNDVIAIDTAIRAAQEDPRAFRSLW